MQTDFNQFNLTDSINSLNQSLTDFTVEGLLNNLTQWRVGVMGGGRVGVMGGEGRVGVVGGEGRVGVMRGEERVGVMVGGG